MATEREKITAIVKVLKQRFNNLSAEELIQIAYNILEVLDNVEKSTKM